MSLALPIRDVTRGQGIAFCLPLRSRPWHQAARLSWSGLLGRAAADPSLGRVTFQTGRGVTFLSGVYSAPAGNAVLWNRNQPRFEVFGAGSFTRKEQAQKNPPRARRSGL